MAYLRCGSHKTTLIVFAYLNYDFIRYPWENWASIWGRWDSKVYLTIANDGYLPKSIPTDYIAFYPIFRLFYPIAIKFISDIFYVSPVYSGVVISVMASVASSYFLFKLVMFDFNNLKTAFLSVIFMNIYPISYFTVAVYSESLFMLFVILSFYLIRKEKFIGGGLAGAGAILTRITGLNVIPAYIWIILRKWRKEKFKLEWLSILILISAGFGVYLLINQAYFGSYRFFYDEKLSFNWTKKLLDYPMEETYNNFHYLVGHIADSFASNYFIFSKGYNSIFTVSTLILIVVGIKEKIPWDYTIYSISSLLFFSSFSWGISDARYTLPIFPIFISMALIRRTWLKYSLAILSVFMLAYFTKIFTGGGWAF